MAGDVTTIYAVANAIRELGRPITQLLPIHPDMQRLMYVKA